MTAYITFSNRQGNIRSYQDSRLWKEVNQIWWGTISNMVSCLCTYHLQEYMRVFFFKKNQSLILNWRVVRMVVELKWLLVTLKRKAITNSGTSVNTLTILIKGNHLDFITQDSWKHETLENRLWNCSLLRP